MTSIDDELVGDPVSLNKESIKGDRRVSDKYRFRLKLPTPLEYSNWSCRGGSWKPMTLNSEEEGRAMLVIRAELVMMPRGDDAFPQSACRNEHGQVSVFTPTVCKCGRLVLISFEAVRTPPFEALKFSPRKGYLPSQSTSALMMPIRRQFTAFPEPVWFHLQLYQTTQLL